jgi:hypothetical protein
MERETVVFGRDLTHRRTDIQEPQKQSPVGVRTPGQVQAGSFQGNIPQGKFNNYRNQGEGFPGFTKSRRPARGGGSISGKLWNNGQSPVGVRTPGQVQAGSFQGNIPQGRFNNYRDQGEGFSGFTKSGRPVKGGGSISGKLWNNRQSPVGVRVPGQVQAGSFQGNIPQGRFNNYRDQGEGFSGYTKARRPAKGGGSISGKLWNNGQSPVGVRTPGQIQAGSFQGNIPQGRFNNYRDQGEGFSGYTKARRPAKGGGSISGKLWNNGQSPIGVRTPGQGSVAAGSFQGNIPQGSFNNYGDQGEGFSGYTKAKRPVKGGGSISGHWNNDQTPVAVRTPGSGGMKAGNFAGNLKATKPKKGGGSISGHWNNNESPVDVRIPGTGSLKAGSFSGNIKASEPKKGGGSISGKLWNNNEHPVEVRTPDKGATGVDYSGKLKSAGYRQNPNVGRESILKQKPDQSTYQVAGLQVKVKQEDYMHNPSSADRALKVLYSGKAYARANAYQGNVKMNKYNAKNLHRDAQFAHSIHDNVKGEKTIMMDFKLLWSKVFRKNDTQPENLKEKSERPRYDKGEKGLWLDDPAYEKRQRSRAEQ